MMIEEDRQSWAGTFLEGNEGRQIRETMKSFEGQTKEFVLDMRVYWRETQRGSCGLRCAWATEF